MRQIKFRAWDKENDKMIYDCGITPHKIPYTIPKEAEGSEDFNYYENSILMQFTGLLDKNGKEVYEGDVVQFIGASSGPVTFGKLSVEDDDIEEYHCWMVVDCPLSHSYSEFEIIGNIYESPELLEAS